MKKLQTRKEIYTAIDNADVTVNDWYQKIVDRIGNNAVRNWTNFHITHWNVSGVDFYCEHFKEELIEAISEIYSDSTK